MDVFIEDHVPRESINVMDLNIRLGKIPLLKVGMYPIHLLKAEMERL